MDLWGINRFTPCDFAFPTNGIKAEATPNTEMILIADVAKRIK